MGIDFYKQSNLLCDNKFVVWNMQILSSSLKRKQDFVAYHRCREAVAAGLVVIYHTGGKRT